MDNRLLLGLWRCMLPVPRQLWQGLVSKDAESTDARLDFMSEEHHLVRNFAVEELPRYGKPLASEYIAQRVGLPLERVKVILDELEENKTFLFRNGRGEVHWAYPVTVAKTPHHASLSTGEQVYAA
jgi:hypothetical protein